MYLDPRLVLTRFRSQSGNFGPLKRCASDDKNAGFHSTARGIGGHEGGGKIIEGVQELEGISVADDEGRLYNETYGSEHSRDDGDRFDEGIVGVVSLRVDGFEICLEVSVGYSSSPASKPFSIRHVCATGIYLVMCFRISG